MWSVIIPIGAFWACSHKIDYDVLIVGGGASGSMAGIQSARMGAKTLIIEEGPWLGGMLTSAGVSAIDGNYKLYSGLWDEFRNNLYDYYGGADSVKTGWVSHVLFEPSVGAKIIKQMADSEPNLDVMFKHKLLSLSRHSNIWIAKVEGDNKIISLKVKAVVDGTELGDVAALLGANYDIGMDSRLETGEHIAPEKANDIIQDLTYVVILKDFGIGADMTIPKPVNYDPTPFLCSCAGKCDPDTIKRVLWECSYMLDYGKLPNRKYMINWPIFGNDYYLNTIEMSPEERKLEYEKAKWFTRCFVYYIQTELGFKNLGIDYNEFPTEDGFPLIPYHRESRRIKGLVRFGIEDLAMPFNQQKALYRTGIAVGDYPIDHHHHAFKDLHAMPELYFYPVPSYSIPLGTLIPNNVDGLIVAEKSISVTNIVNGTTRLQPVCILIGQAAGTLAALSAKLNVSPKDVPVRMVQKHLLETNAYIMPYSDVLPVNPCFKAVQRIGATGILKGEGKNVGWENFTFFYPDSLVTVNEIKDAIEDLYPQFKLPATNNNYITVIDLLNTIVSLNNYLGKETQADMLEKQAESIWNQHHFNMWTPDKKVNRAQFSVLFDYFINPFETVQINHFGSVIQ